MDKRKCLMSFFRPITDRVYYMHNEEKKKEILVKWYKSTCGRDIDIENPKTFNEKIQWIKLYDSTDLKTALADKYLVRNYVAKHIGKDHLVPLLGVWRSFDEIDFNTLPDRFVLKANHGSGWNAIIKDKNKADWKSIKRNFDIWMKSCFTTEYGYELHYMNIPPRIIAEQYIEEYSWGGVRDYRFFCFSGTPLFVWVDENSGTPQHTRTIFDTQWVKQNYQVNYPEIVPVPEKPSNLPEMLRYAAILSEPFCFARVDFYSVAGKTLFGEITFTPQSGTGKWNSEQENELYGSLIHLPEKKPIPKRNKLL